MQTIDYPKEKRKFMPEFERYEPLLQDHTAMNVLDTCDRKYFYRIVLGRNPRRSNNQVLLDAGNAYHKFREVLELKFAETKSQDIAYGEAMKTVLKCDLDVPPPESKYSYMDKTALIKCCDKAFEHWRKEKELGRIRVVAVEQPFNLMLPDGSYTSGRADQIVEWNRYWGRDFKFTGKTEDNFKRSIEPNDQGTRYIYSESQLLNNRVEGIIFEGLHHSYTKKDGLRIHIVSHLSQRTDYQLKAWLDDKIHINRQLQINREHDMWPMRTHNCGYCDFANVCRKSSERGMMAALEQDFALKPWDHSKTVQEEL